MIRRTPLYHLPRKTYYIEVLRERTPNLITRP
jgi:hypothetical protein